MRLSALASAGAAVLLVVGAAAACGAGDEGAGAVASPAVTSQPLGRDCPAVIHPQQDDTLALARAVIDAAQAQDLEAVCALLGRPTVPPGLSEYAAAVADGMTTDLEHVGSKSDPDARIGAHRFAVPGQDREAFLTLGFQRQEAGQVLIAVFFPEGSLPEEPPSG